MKRFLLVFLLISLSVTSASARDVPAARGYVNDLAGLMSPGATLKLEQFLRDFEASDSTQIVVLTVDSLENETVESFAVKVFETWKIGQKGKDNGALLLLAKQERKLRIEVGYGLEGRLTDLLAGRIIDQEISPQLKQGNFDGGIIAGVVAMAEAVRGEYQGTGQTRRQKEKGSPFGLLFLLFFGLPLLARLGGHRGGHRRGGFYVGGPFMGGGGFGGGGGGFSGGGGGSGGGGASGGW